MSTINIENVGPIERLSIPAEPGKITVLTADNGSGKTEALKAVDAIATGKGRLEPRDGQLKGSVEWRGARLSVSRSNRRTGELDVATLEGRFSIDDLVDPEMKDPAAADAKAIKALVGLVGAEADPSLFHGLVSSREEFEELVSPASIDTDDPVQMAARIKRDLEKAARLEEDQAEHASGHAKAHREAAGDVDTSINADADRLHGELEAARRKLDRLTDQDEHAAGVLGDAKVARQKLDEAKSKREGPTVEEAEQDLADAREDESKAEAKVEELRKQLREAGAQLERSSNAVRLAEVALEAASDHKRLIAGWEETVAKAESIDRPSPEEIKAARSEVNKAREAVEEGVRIRDAQEHARQAKEQTRVAYEHRKRADQLRGAAKGTDGVLSEIVQQSGAVLRVETFDGKQRLVTDTARGVTFYRQLSDGERWKIALDIAIEALAKVPSEFRLLTIKQRAWEGLDRKNRREIAEHIKGRDIAIITAECSRDAEQAELQPTSY